MRIAIVNDVPMAVEALRRAVAFEPSHEVVWVASNGAEAGMIRNVTPCAKPDFGKGAHRYWEVECGRRIDKFQAKRSPPKRAWGASPLAACMV